MKNIILILILISFSCAGFAQSVKKINSPFKIIGSISDSSSGKPLEYATVSLFSGENPKPVNGSTSDISGHFEITDVAEGIYSAKIESIGYQSFTIKNIVISNKVTVKDFKNIRIIKKTKTLQSVEITVPGKLIENKIDKIVFNAERDITSQTGVATDILKKIPQVSVDIDGNVQLSGSSSVRFLINGKPSTFYGSNITDVLQALPASQVKSVEVITNPGAKYDAEGLGGIINIILKSNTSEGINGNISLSAGTRLENLSFNLNVRKSKFGFNAFVLGNARLSAITTTNYERSSVINPDTLLLLNQDGNYKTKRHGLQTGLGFDWTPNEKNTLSYSLNFNNFGNSGNGLTNQSQSTIIQMNRSTIADSFSLNNISNSSNYNDIESSIDYKKTFNNKDQELDISLSSSFGKDEGTAKNNESNLKGDSIFYGTMSKNPGKENEYELQIDYTQPIKENVILGLGGKINIRDITSTSDVLSFEPFNGKYLPDGFLSNTLNYDQKVYALYSEISFPVFKLFDAKIGGRYEHTDIKSFFSNSANTGIPGYNTFVPSVFFIKKITEDQSIKLSYSRRIERPDYRDLNPYINTSDPKNLSSGNPFLEPEIGSRYEFSYNINFKKAGSFMASLFYRTSDHDIQPYIIFYPYILIGDSTYYNASISTKQNIGLEKNIGLNLFADIHLITNLSLRTNLFFFERHTINDIDPGSNSNSFNYRVNANISYQFVRNLAGEFFGNFNSARNEVQGKYPSFTSYSFALRKRFLNKKTSLALTASNVFYKYLNQTTSVHGTDFTATTLRKIPFRSIGINFTWKFGKLEFKKSNAESNDNLNGSNE